MNRPKETHSVARDRADLYQFLSDGQFLLAREIPMKARRIRDICERYPDMFFSTQKGYKLVRHASDDELRNSINDLRSRIKALTSRANGLEAMLFKRERMGDMFGQGVSHNSPAGDVCEICSRLDAH